MTDQFPVVPDGIQPVEWSSYPTIEGIAWPIATDGNYDHAWVERDDGAALFEDDLEAFCVLVNLLVQERGADNFIAGFDTMPGHEGHSHPYVDLFDWPAHNSPAPSVEGMKVVACPPGTQLVRHGLAQDVTSCEPRPVVRAHNNDLHLDVDENGSPLPAEGYWP